MTNKTLQLLRNSTVFTAQADPAKSAHDVAIEALQSQLAAAKDGEVILARYQDGNDVRTLLGVAYKPAEGNNKYEIFDNQGGNDAIDNAINALVNNATGNYATLGGIQGIIQTMDKTANAENGKVVTTVSEADGVVSETKANVKDLQLGGYEKSDATGSIGSTDTINTALSKLENKTAAITVASADKTVTVTTAGGGTDLAVNIDGTTLVKDSTNGTISSNLKILKEIDNLDSNVREQYKLVYGSNTNAIGDTIKIYKDSALYRVYLGHVDDTITSPTNPTVINGTGSEALCFIYQKADGTYELVAVNVESFLQESEFENGLEVDSEKHTVSVKIDSTSEGFLTVGTGGVKLSGVQNAINAAVAGLDASESQTAGADGLALSITEVDGIITEISGSIAAETYDAYGAAATAKSEVIGESTDASSANTINGAKKYADEAVATAVDGLDVTDAAVANQFITSVSETNGKIAVTRSQPAAAGVTISDNSEYFTATNVEGALAELATFNCGTY